MKKKILIVDDCKETRRNLRSLMDGMGCLIDEAVDGEAAFDYCMTRTPDVIFLDWHMPNLSGLGFLRLYRDTLGMQRKLPPVIFRADDAHEDCVTEARELGVAEIIMGPLERKHIHATLSKMGVSA